LGRRLAFRATGFDELVSQISLDPEPEACIFDFDWH
jgi:hypothetical protein